MVILFFSRGKHDFSMPLNLTAVARSERQSRSVATQWCSGTVVALLLRALPSARVWGLLGGAGGGKGIFPSCIQGGIGVCWRGGVSEPGVQQVSGADSWLLNNGYQRGRSVRACRAVLHLQSGTHTVTMTSLAFLLFFSFGAEGATSKLSSVQYDIS